MVSGRFEWGCTGCTCAVYGCTGVQAYESACTLYGSAVGWGV
ncbi:uncharacterized protein Nmag_1468 [Natrialba magadii ATCC 43099]|uniref:Uncharacterized protein n=1 Tax=Natrialba magadii (strain ATCC 43099 / DSM 3394 / CCM 3739 / CIP 104546 / IAM 13178 / JCM 8861 / NBRC 102185 / NCIMB 2190 / MS3) TaxID=547559 RepID=D3STM9_NATMM|nr:uncharacterized protein Nmag_1468 [Natrialba magadii ATCC 43099]